MALFFSHTEQEFHLVNGNFKFLRDTNHTRHSKTIQADGDELMFILDNYKNIPSCKARVQKWEGEAAKFILGHLCWQG